MIKLKDCAYGCGRQILFVKTRKLDKFIGEYVSGASMPVNPELIWGDGQKTLIAVHPAYFAGRVIPKASGDYQGYEPHFGTCTVYLDMKKTKKISYKEPTLFD